MSDARFRHLERAVASGDEGASLSLATAYLRRGKSRDALGILTHLELSQAEHLEARAWRCTLSRLRPAVNVPGARLYHSLRGWVGDRYAVLGVHQNESFVVLDREQGALIPLRGLPQPTRLHGVCPSGLLCMSQGNATLLRPEGGAWLPEPLPLFVELQRLPHPIDLSRDERVLLSITEVAGSHGARRELHVRDIPTERSRSHACGAFAYDWDRDLLVWTCPRGLGIASLTGDEPSRLVAVHSGEIDPQGIFQLLRDGRLVTGRPAALFDPTSPGPLRTFSQSTPRGPARLSHDGSALLCVQGDRPARLPFTGTPRAGHAFAPTREPCFWHPRADIAVWGGLDRQAELVTFAPDGARARVFLRLPHGLWPLGWTPDGYGLLLARKLTGMQSLLELWT